MEITVSQEQSRTSVTVLKVTGELNAATYEQSQSAAEKAIDDGGHNVVVDLGSVAYMSSAGMRTLNQILNWLTTSSESKEVKKAIASGKVKSPHFKLPNPSARVLQALKTAGFDMFLEIYHDHQQAIASF